MNMHYITRIIYDNNKLIISTVCSESCVDLEYLNCPPPLWIRDLCQTATLLVSLNDFKTTVTLRLVCSSWHEQVRAREGGGRPQATLGAGGGAR